MVHTARVDGTAEASAARVVKQALAEGRDALLESEGFALVEALGIRVPVQRFVCNRAEAASVDLAAFPGDRVVVKAASPAVPHKTDLGAVAIVPAALAAVRAAVDRMAVRLSGYPQAGFTIAEYVPHVEGLGGELLLGLRRTEDFGPVAVIGPGGVHAELLARHLLPGADLAVVARGLLSPSRLAWVLAEKPATRIAAGMDRHRRALLPLEDLATLADRLLAFADSPEGAAIAELEINPLGLTPDGPVALDVLVTLRRAAPPAAVPERPLHKIGNLLHPGSIALIGVSQDMNPGRLILRNLLREGFPPDRIAIVKRGVERIEGVRCYPDVAALPEPVDLCVLAVAAPQVPGLVDQLVASRKAESLIVIPSGVDEQAVRATIAAARRTEWGGPVVNGGNCLGVRSAPGRYDATFIPRYKVAGERAPAIPLALIAQSGAFAVSRWSKLAGLDPLYLISVGNQADLTLGDYFTYLKHDPAIQVFACYAEGFRPLDGRRWLDAAKAIVDSGRTVLLYRGARTPAGVKAGASHTAAIAGDYVVTRELARATGVLVADSLEEFDDLLRLFGLLADRHAAGMRVGAISNAGFECVATADSLGAFDLARLSSLTVTLLEEALAEAGLGGLVDMVHPLDVTPMANDAVFATCARILLADENVDVGVVGCVPLTAALQTLPAGPGHTEDLDAADAVAARLGRLRAESPKPWIAVVDAGPAYDPFAARLESLRIPTFRSVDRGLKAFARWCMAATECGAW